MGTSIEKLTDRFIETAIDDEVVIMDLESGAFFSLSGTGLSIWQAIDGQRDRNQLVAALCEEYQVSAPEVTEDVDAFLADLGEAGLLAGV